MVQEGPDRHRLLDALTTEHSTLQAARAASVAESVGRSLIFLGSLSASLVALALLAQSDSTVDDFRLVALPILTALLFLGIVTFVRIIETGIEDTVCGLAINRIRHFYLELAGDDACYFLLGGHDDIEGALANLGHAQSPWRPFVSVASVVALVNSMVAGAVAGIAVDSFGSRPAAVLAAVCVAAGAIAVHYRLGLGRFVRALDRFTPIFPSRPATERG